MQNPLEHEEAAFRIVLYAIAYFAPIVVASWIATWLGFLVFVAASAVVAVLIERGRRRSRTAEVPRGADAAAGVADTHRVVVLADEALSGAGLVDAVAGAAGAADDVLLVCPVPVAAADGEEIAAEERLEATVEALAARGVRARGVVERAAPLAALERALGPYGADVVLVATTAGAASGVDAGLAERAQEQLGASVTRVVVGGLPETGS